MRLSVPQAVRRDSVWVLLLGAAVGACAVSGHAPVWMLLVWALTLGPWCLSERRRSVVYALPVLLALLPALPLLADPLALSATYLRAALAGVALALYLIQLDGQNQWLGLGALALAFALAPGPLALLGLVGAALLRAQASQRGLQRQTSARAWAWLALGLLVLALAAALLPRPSLPQRHAATGGAAQVQPSDAPGTSGTKRPPGLAPARPSPVVVAPPVATPLSFQLLDALTPFVLGAMALIASVVVVLALRERKRRGEPWRPEDLLLAAALLVAYVMVGLYAVTVGRGGLGGAGSRSGAAAGAAKSAGPALVTGRESSSGLLNLVGWLGVTGAALFILLALVGAVLLLRLTVAGRAESTAAPAPAARPGAATPEDRVRRAYRQSLDLLAGAGLARAGAETPREFLARLGEARPELRPDAAQITALYEPVRYGEQTGEPGASAAEAALERLRAQLAPERTA